MQGMMVMLMAVSGLGCHHGHSGHATSACYDACYAADLSGCYDDYAATAYSACYDNAGYSACFDAGPSCYTYDSCYVPEPDRGHGCGLFRGLKRLFGKHHRSSSCYASSSCYDSCYSAGYDAFETSYSACYGQPVFGSYTPVYPGGGGYASNQGGYVSPQGGVLMGSPTKGYPIGGSSQGYVSGAPQGAVIGAPQVPSGVGSAPVGESVDVQMDQMEPTTPSPETPPPPPANEPELPGVDAPVIPATPST